MSPAAFEPTNPVMRFRNKTQQITPSYFTNHKYTKAKIHRPLVRDKLMDPPHPVSEPSQTRALDGAATGTAT